MLRRARDHVRRQFVGYLALFVALGGVSYAFTLPANSVGKRHIRAGAVTAGKLAPPLRAGIAAASTPDAGPPGPVGPPGPQGAAGPRGPSNAYSVVRYEATNCGTATGSYTCTTAPVNLGDLPAGSYLALAKARATVDPEQGPVGVVATCRLSAGTGSAQRQDTSDAYLIGDDLGRWPPGVKNATLSLQLPFTFTGTGAFTLSCSGASAKFTDLRVSAVRVETLRLEQVG